MLSDSEVAQAQRAAHIPHVLHTGQRIWIAPNPFASLWVEILHAWNFEPFAALGCTIALQFEVDQFGTLVFPAEDLQSLFGVTTSRLTVFDSLASHIAAQTAEGHVVLVDLDPFHLPDTPDLYGARHGTTLVAIDRLDPVAETASYYRQGRRFELSGADYHGAFKEVAAPVSAGEFHPTLLRSLTCVKRRVGTSTYLSPEETVKVSWQAFQHHLARLPAQNPIAAFRAIFQQRLELLVANDESYRHAFVYGTLSQLGSHFELFSAYLSWLAERGYAYPKRALQASRQIVSETLVCQLRLLRATSRGHIDRCDDCLDRIQHNYDNVVAALTADR